MDARRQLAAPSAVLGTRAERQGEFSVGATRHALREPVTLAALALALLWDPAADGD